MSPNSQWHIRQRDGSDSSVPVSDAVADFLASPEVKRLQPKTRDEHEHVLNMFADWCATHSLVRSSHAWAVAKVDHDHAEIFLNQVNDTVVSLFLEHVQATRKPSKNTATQLSSHTLYGYTKDIKRLLNWCLLDEQYVEHVKGITVSRIKKPKLDETIIDAFTTEQLEALKKACAKEESEHLRLRDFAIIAVLLDIGIRATELVTLTIEHVHLDPADAHIRIYGKGRKWGEVGLGDETRRLVGKYIRQFREPTIEHRHETELSKLVGRQQQAMRRQIIGQETLFVNRAGYPLTKSGLGQIIERLGEWADITGVRCSPHTFRHTFAKRFMEANNNDIYRLSKPLRHTSVKVTENYLKSLRQVDARKGAKSVYDNLKSACNSNRFLIIHAIDLQG